MQWAGIMTHGTIFKIKRYALHDGPGIRTTVFLKGCPLACRWCHNPEGLDPQPQLMSRRTSDGSVDETVGVDITVDALMQEIEKDLLFYDESDGGVTFSGGEPLAQPQFLDLLLKACNQRQIHVALDTSGAASTAVIDQILPQVQLVLFDLKIMDANRHRRYTGVSNRIILNNLKRVARGPVPVRLRIPLIPSVTDGADNLAQIVRFAGALETIQGIDLLPYHRIGGPKYRRLGMTDFMPAIDPPKPERLDAIKHQFESAGFAVSIGG
jgi:pyruvate formate lyase activating enzyme